MLEEQKRKLRLLLNDKEALRAFLNMVRIISALFLMLMCIHYASMSNADTTLFYLLSFTFFFAIAASPIINDMRKMLSGSGKETSNAHTAMIIITACAMMISCFYILSKMVHAVENPLPTMSICGYIFCYFINLFLICATPAVWVIARFIEHDMNKCGIHGSDGSREPDINQGELLRDAEGAVPVDNVPSSEALRVHKSDIEESADVDHVFVREVTMLLGEQRHGKAISL